MSADPHIIKETTDFVAVNKPSGFISSEDLKEPQMSIFKLDDLQKGHQNHVLTRLDRPVSGLVLISKRPRFNKYYLKAQDDKKLTKEYIGIVEGRVKEEQGDLTNDLVHDKKKRKSFVMEKANRYSKAASLSYTLLKRLDNYSILKIKIKKGKFHQIRSQLAHMGHPIKGDVKYGARRKNKDRSIYLHSYKLSFMHPVDGQIDLEVEPPADDKLWDIVREQIKK